MGKSFNKFYSNYTYMLNTINNTEEVINAAKNKDKWLSDKIEASINRGELSGLTLEKVLYDIYNGDPYAMAKFRKDPSKQNKSETIQTHYLKNGGLTVNKKGKHCYVVGGTIVQDKKLTQGDTKSIDFDAEFNGHKFYLTAKVINTVDKNGNKVGGGGQDSTTMEMIRTAKVYGEYVRIHPESDYRFILLLDGAYFDEEEKERVRSVISEPEKVMVMDSDELLEYFNKGEMV